VRCEQLRLNRVDSSLATGHDFHRLPPATFDVVATSATVRLLRERPEASTT
jgi:hypothetical protein